MRHEGVIYVQPEQKLNIRRGVSLLQLLGVLFIGLKLTGHIEWSWWLVLLPLYGPWVVLLSVLASAFFVIGVVTVIEDSRK